MKNNFMQRAITGIIFVAVLIGCILGGPVSFGILFAIISAAAINEFGNLINKQEDVQMNKRICILGGIFLFLCFFYYGINPAQTGIFVPYLALIIYLMVSELYLKKKNPLNNWAYAMFSQIYLALPFALLNVLAFHSDETISVSQYNPILPLSIFIFNWVLIVPECSSESTAYLNASHPRSHGKVLSVAVYSALSLLLSWLIFSHLCQQECG